MPSNASSPAQTETQETVEELQRKIEEQNALLAEMDRAAPVSGGLPSEHLVQAGAHLQQAFTGMFKSVCPAPPIRRSSSRVSSGQKPLNREKTLIPTWNTSLERHLQKHEAQHKGIEIAPEHSGRNGDTLREHEYVLEDEWDQAQTSVINPKSSWKETWDIGVLTFILYSAVVVPFRICFSAEAEGNVWTFEVFISIFFIIDVLFNFNTAYPMDDKWVTSRPRITSRYLSGWFWIDAPSSLPVELITAMMHGEGSSHLSLLRFLRLFRLLRLLRLLKVDKYVAMMEDKFEVSLVSLRVLGMVIKLLFMVHMLGCFWFYVGAQAAENGEEVTWISTYDDGRAVDGSVERQYIYSIYWSLTTLTTVGYGDITPTNQPERIYCLFAMLVGAMMFGYMMSTIGSMVTQLDRQAALVEDRMDAVKEWMISRNIPRRLVIRVRKYYEHYYTRKSAFDEEDFVRNLTPSLRTEVTAVLLRDSLGHFPLLALMGADFQQEVYPRLKPVSYANLDVIYSKGQVSEDIFFLRKGVVDVLAGGSNTKVLYRIHQGQYFGEEALTHERRGCSVVSNGWSELWSLTRDVLDDVVEKFPELIPKLEKFVLAELERKSRLYALSYRILIDMAKKDPPRRAALILQKAWTKFSAMQARAESRYSMTASNGSSGRSFRSSVSVSAPARDATPEAMQAALRDIQSQLLGIKREMRTGQGVVPQVTRKPVRASSTATCMSSSAASMGPGSDVDA